MGFQNGFQNLSLSTVFADFPQRVKDWRYEIEDVNERIAEALDERLKTNAARFYILTRRLSPVKLASNLGMRKTRLAVLHQRNASAIRGLFSTRDENMRVKMASLDALSPLSVLNRGFSLTRNESGEILRDTKDVEINDKLKIRLANGKLEAVVKKIG